MQLYKSDKRGKQPKTQPKQESRPNNQTQIEMKSLAITFGLVAIMPISACGNSIESDAKRLAELQCRAKLMSEKMMSGESELADLSATISLAKGASELMEELDGKYTTEKEKEQLEKALRKAMEDCK